MNPHSSSLHRLYNARHVIRQLVASTLRVRYQHSALGFLWTLLHPAMMLAILAVVFSQVLRFNIEKYPVFLFCGLLPWQCFAGAVTTASKSLIHNQSMIRKIKVDLLVFPISSLSIAAFNLAMSMVALFVILMFFGATLSVHSILVVAGLAYLFLFAFGIALIAMTLTTYFRDFEHFIAVALQAGYFLTPIFYRPHDIPALKGVIQLNPLTWVISFFRHGLYYNTWAPTEVWAYATVSVGIALTVGLLVYKRFEHEFVFHL